MKQKHKAHQNLKKTSIQTLISKPSETSQSRNFRICTKHEKNISLFLELICDLDITEPLE